MGTQLSKTVAVFQIFLVLSISQSLAETCFSKRIEGLSQFIEYIEKLELRSNDFNIRLLEFESQKSVLMDKSANSNISVGSRLNYSQDTDDIQDGHTSNLTASVTAPVRTPWEHSVDRKSIQNQLNKIDIQVEKIKKNDLEFVLNNIFELAHIQLSLENLTIQVKLTEKQLFYYRELARLKDEKNLKNISDNIIQKIKLENKISAFALQQDTILTSMSPRIKIDDFLSSQIHTLAKHNILRMSNWSSPTNDICDPTSIDKRIFESEKLQEEIALEELETKYLPKFSLSAEAKSRTEFNGRTSEDYRVGFAINWKFFDGLPRKDEKRQIIDRIMILKEKIWNENTLLLQKAEEFYRVEQAVLDNLSQVKASIDLVALELDELQNRASLGLTTYEEQLSKELQKMQLVELQIELQHRLLNFWTSNLRYFSGAHDGS